MSSLVKIYPGGAKLFHADRQPETVRFTYMMNLTVAFCNFVNVPRKKNLGKKSIYRVNLYKQTVTVGSGGKMCVLVFWQVSQII
jgi:hypothetical protein